jgi:hypothetical protein
MPPNASIQIDLGNGAIVGLAPGQESEEEAITTNCAYINIGGT